MSFRPGRVGEGKTGDLYDAHDALIVLSCHKPGKRARTQAAQYEPINALCFAELIEHFGALLNRPLLMIRM
ncbi:MAG: hypothetical protein AAF918_08640 [Pseudomonadota bacterium]